MKFLIIPILACTCAGSAVAAGAPKAPPDLTQDRAVDRKLTYNLGATGLRGWIYTKPLNFFESQQGRTTTASRQILVTHVGKNSPADGVIKVDDVILGTAGKIFSDDARQSMALAIQEAEKPANQGILKMNVWRSGKIGELSIKLRVMGTYTDTAPYQCAKSKLIFEDACKMLEKEPLKIDWTGAVNGLALLATGEARYLPKLRDFAHELGPNTLQLDLKDGMVVWDWGYRNLFLCEYYLITGDKEVLHAINQYTTFMAKGQSMYGTFGHGLSRPTTDGRFHGSIPPYGPVNAAGLIGNIAIVMGRKCGVQDPEIDPAIDRASRFFGYFVDKGAVPYGEHMPWANHDNNGKNAMAAVFFALQGNKLKETQYYAKMVTASYKNREYGHTGQGFSYLWGALGANTGGPRAAAAFVKQASWHLDLVRRCDGSFTYDGNEQYGPGETDDGTYFGKSGYSGLSPNATYVLTYSLPLKKICITGHDSDPATWLKTSDVSEAIAAGRLDLDRHSMTNRELISAFDNWSPVARGWLAEELGKRPDSATLVQELILMAEGADASKRQAAAEALGYIGDPGALPVLTRLLTHEDRWLRVKAAQALKNMRDKAKPVVSAMLKALIDTAQPVFPVNWDDPIQLTHGELAAALFDGLLKNSIKEIDPKLLYPAIQAVAQNPDGMARATLKGIFEKLLTAEDVEELAPDLVEAIRTPCPADTMFGAEIRMGAFKALTKYHYVEGIEMGVIFAKTQGGHGSESRTGVIMQQIAGYGAAARNAIPQLREVITQLNDQTSSGGFPADLNRKRIADVENAIQTIENATGQPETRSISVVEEQPDVLEVKSAPKDSKSAEIAILTTPDGANLPPSSSVDEFPLLLRLDKDSFDFSQARPHGEDVRFTTAAGAPLPYQIEEWEPTRGSASVWVRIPRIDGNAIQLIRMLWGDPDAVGKSDGKSVFNDSNGYLSVWHMNDPAHDEVGTLDSKNEGTTTTAGIIGTARHFAGGQGISGGKEITAYPTGANPHSSEAWFRAERSNGRMLAWGNEKRQGKVVLKFTSPPHIEIGCYFSGADVTSDRALLPFEWNHVVHTYENGDSRVYVNGRLDGVSTKKEAPLQLTSPSKLWIGGWHDAYDFVGDIDEVRVSKVKRSADWVHLQYENQKPLQTLTGAPIQQGNDFSVSQDQVTLAEGTSLTLNAKAGGAFKTCWILKADGKESIVSTDRLTFKLNAGRVTGDQKATLIFKAIFADGVKSKEIPVAIKEQIEDPAFTLKAPPTWDGRTLIEVTPQITNRAAMESTQTGPLKVDWSLDGIAVIKNTSGESLVLNRAQNSGVLSITATISSGGKPITKTATIQVTEPKQDTWAIRTPDKGEQPEDHQFYPRDDKNEGTLFYNGQLQEAADAVFINVYADEKPYKSERAKTNPDKSYALAVKLKPGLIKYRVEFGTKTGGRESVIRTVTDIVCGDAYLVNGQSNAVATDWGDQKFPETNEWIRSFGSTGTDPGSVRWGPAIRKSEGGRLAIGYWAFDLAKHLMEKHRIPVCIINGAVGGTRIDLHQPNPQDNEDSKTIYGRLLWRTRQAKITHGIRGIFWHQGENDQGADGPTGGFGWENYRQLFIDLAAAWKQDYPNIQHYYVFQIWPYACSMGRSGSDSRLREVQRTLPRLFSKMSIMSTLGIDPPGSCHYPPEGYAELARLIEPLVEHYNYGIPSPSAITPPDLKEVRYSSSKQDEIVMEFDQKVCWDDTLSSQFYLDGQAGKVVSGKADGCMVTLKLSGPTDAQNFTYINGQSWNPKTLLRGETGIAALTFCEVPISPAPKSN